MMKKQICNTDIKLAVIFASLILAIALLTKENDNSFIITLLLLAGYFTCTPIIKSKEN